MKKILVIDDEALVRRSLVRALKVKGFEVLEAADGSEGLMAWRATDPDLVFLDVLMPGLTGPQVLREIGPSRRAKVILMTAYAGNEDVEKDSAQLADLFLLKPFDDIFETVQQAQELLT